MGAIKRLKQSKHEDDTETYTFNELNLAFTSEVPFISPWFLPCSSASLPWGSILNAPPPSSTNTHLPVTAICDAWTAKCEMRHLGNIRAVVHPERLLFAARQTVWGENPRAWMWLYELGSQVRCFIAESESNLCLINYLPEHGGPPSTCSPELATKMVFHCTRWDLFRT